MTNSLGNVKKTVCTAALLLAAVPFVAPIHAHAANVTITSGTFSIGQGARKDLLDIIGTGFQTGAVATISGTEAWLKNPVVFSATEMFAFATVAPSATTGARTLTVTNPDGSSATCPGCVVIDPAPVVTSIDGLQTGAGSAGFFARSVTVHGSGFVTGLPRVFVKGAGIVAWPAVQVTSPTTATVGMVVSPLAAPGAYDVTFTNGDAGVGRCTACFVVSPGPRVDHMTPSSFIRGNTYGVTLVGHHFDQGAVVGVSVLHGGITVSNVSVSTDGRRHHIHHGDREEHLPERPGHHPLRPSTRRRATARSVPIPLKVTKSCGTTTC